jgi:hypothetical protein
MDVRRKDGNRVLAIATFFQKGENVIDNDGSYVYRYEKVVIPPRVCGIAVERLSKNLFGGTKKIIDELVIPDISIANYDAVFGNCEVVKVITPSKAIEKYFAAQAKKRRQEKEEKRKQNMAGATDAEWARLR